MTAATSSSVASYIGGLLVLVALLLVGGCDRDERRAAPEVGRIAPSFQLETLSHQRFFLNDQRGKSVVLIFWHTTCQVCKREMVQVDKLRQQLGDGRVAVASVLNDPENIDMARRMVSGLKLGFPTLLDHGGEISDIYRVEEFPTTVVITPDGKVGLYRKGYTAPLMRQLRSVIESQW